ncbi:MAG: SusC/RagA family protein, partial [Muribaculaceae bacterium]|nr:SusC/RagA family protein [Muribaculaceae bacterium]
PWANYGKVKNEGMEFSINYMKNFGKDWTVNFRANFTYAKNTVVEADEPPGRIGTHRAMTGQSMNTLWGLTAERLFTADDFDADGNLLPGIPVQSVGATTVRPGDIKYVDVNGDGEVTEDDEGYIGGTYDPRIVYGFGATVRFKWIDFGFFFQGIGDSHRIIGSDLFLPGSRGELSAMFFTNYEDRWTEENPSQDVFYPRLDYVQNKNNYRASTWWKKDMSFLRCKNIEIGYSFSPAVLKTLHLTNLRLYVSGNDLFYFSKFKLWDPEINSDNGNKYPGMASVMFGLNLGF